LKKQKNLNFEISFQTYLKLFFVTLSIIPERFNEQFCCVAELFRFKVEREGKRDALIKQSDCR